MTTATLQKIPRVCGTGRKQKYHSDNFGRSISHLAGHGQAKKSPTDENFIKRRRSLEREKVYDVQLSRARRQIFAYWLWDSIDRWEEIPAEVGTDD